MRCPFCDHPDTQVVETRESDEGDSIRRRRRCLNCEKLLSLGLREVGSEQIGELVMRELKKLDKIAYVRFASVYRKFEDVDEFAEAVLEVRARRKRSSE